MVVLIVEESLAGEASGGDIDGRMVGVGGFMGWRDCFPSFVSSYL